jgi:hypothetical protein
LIKTKKKRNVLTSAADLIYRLGYTKDSETSSKQLLVTLDDDEQKSLRNFI